MGISGIFIGVKDKIRLFIRVIIVFRCIKRIRRGKKRKFEV